MKTTYRLKIALLLFAFAAPCLAAISTIEKNGAYYNIFDENGKKTATISTQIGTLLGWGSDYFIVQNGAFYNLHDESGKKYKTLSTNIGEIATVSSTTFIVRRQAGSAAWLDTYDKTGTKTSTRPERK